MQRSSDPPVFPHRAVLNPPPQAGHRGTVDLDALQQWSTTGKVKRQSRQHRKYRLGRWQNRSFSSWNPPANSITRHSNASVLSVDISYKPSESRRASILTTSDSDDSDDDENGPLAQVLLRENDEIWNNRNYRFTFYSPRTGTVRAADVQSLQTDNESGLDDLIRQATGEVSKVDEKIDMPTVTVSNGLLHPNDALGRGRSPSAGSYDAPKLPEDDGCANLFWLDIVDPVDSEIIAVSRIFDLHPLTTEELLLMKDEALVQDSFKSFKHYDIICYHTSIAAYNDEPWAQEDVPLDTMHSAETNAEGDKQKAGEEGLRYRIRQWLKRPADPNVPVPEIMIPSPSADEPARDDDTLDEPIPFYSIVLTRGIITLHRRRLPHVRNTIARLLLDEDTVKLTPDYIAYLLLDDITDTLVPTTRMLELEVDAVDELVLILAEADHDDILKRIGIERRHALWLVRLLHGKAEVLGAIERRVQAKRHVPRLRIDDDTHSQLMTSDEEEGDIYGWDRKPVRGRHDEHAPDVAKYLADVHDHLLALTASVHHCERILARAHGNYLARINLELTNASNTTNGLATQAAILAGIFLPLNLVAGLWGQNVKVPGQDRDDLLYFGIICGCMATFVIFALAFFRWRRLI
ncbi:CorA metal ion transporter [Linderina pennispora]|nr:CorA metal ion transporter [Linderina pennispora]